MKILLVCAFAAAAVFASGAVHASADLANTHCGKCHQMDKKSKGPSYKAMSAKFKGKPEAEIIKAIEDPKGDHPEVKVKADDMSTVVKWMMKQ